MSLLSYARSALVLVVTMAAAPAIAEGKKPPPPDSVAVACTAAYNFCRANCEITDQYDLNSAGLPSLQHILECPDKCYEQFLTCAGHKPARLRMSVPSSSLLGNSATDPEPDTGQVSGGNGGSGINDGIFDPGIGNAPSDPGGGGEIIY